MAKLDKRLQAIAEKVDAEKVTISVEYDKDSAWASRGKKTWPYTVTVEWEDDTRTFRASATAVTLDAALDAAESELNGILVRERAT